MPFSILNIYCRTGFISWEQFFNTQASRLISDMAADTNNTGEL